MKRPNSYLRGSSDGTQDSTKAPEYSGTVWSWNSTRPQLRTVKQSQLFLRLCHSVYLYSQSLPFRARRYRQQLAFQLQLPPMVVRKFLDPDLMGLAVTISFIVSHWACSSPDAYEAFVPSQLRVCGHLASLLMQHIPSIHKQLLLWTEGLAILSLVLRFPCVDASDRRLRQRLMNLQLQPVEYTFSRFLSPCVVYLKLPANWKGANVECYRSRTQMFYIGSTAVSISSREWNCCAKLKQLVRGQYVQAEPALMVWASQGSCFSFATLVLDTFSYL